MVLLEAQRKEKASLKVRELKSRASVLQKKFRSELNIRQDAVNVVPHQAEPRQRSKQPWEAETSTHSAQRNSIKSKAKLQAASSAAIKVSLAKPSQKPSGQPTNVVSQVDYTIGMSRALEDDLNESQEKEPNREQIDNDTQQDEYTVDEQQEHIEFLKEQLVGCEEALRKKTEWVLKHNTLVRDFQKFRQEAQIKSWQALQKYDKEDLASSKKQLAEMQQQNKNLASEAQRLRRMTKKVQPHPS